MEVTTVEEARGQLRSDIAAATTIGTLLVAMEKAQDSAMFLADELQEMVYALQEWGEELDRAYAELAGKQGAAALVEAKSIAGAVAASAWKTI